MTDVAHWWLIVVGIARISDVPSFVGRTVTVEIHPEQPDCTAVELKKPKYHGMNSMHRTKVEATHRKESRATELIIPVVDGLLDLEHAPLSWLS
jgi:pheromone shutdown protein TraB